MGYVLSAICSWDWHNMHSGFPIHHADTSPNYSHILPQFPYLTEKANEPSNYIVLAIDQEEWVAEYNMRIFFNFYTTIKY